jgi:hypothetical protein
LGSPRRSGGPERLIATLSGASGALGALLAAIGLYGLLAYTVACRILDSLRCE